MTFYTMFTQTYRKYLKDTSVPAYGGGRLNRETEVRLAILFLFLPSSPELQALLMNQLTVKVSLELLML